MGLFLLNPVSKVGSPATAEARTDFYSSGRPILERARIKFAKIKFEKASFKDLSLGILGIVITALTSPFKQLSIKAILAALASFRF